jgi:hypothetical protein
VRRFDPACEVRYSHLHKYPVTLGFVALVIARRPKADVAISYPSKVEAVPVPKRLTMMPTVSIVTGYKPRASTFAPGYLSSKTRDSLGNSRPENADLSWKGYSSPNKEPSR